MNQPLPSLSPRDDREQQLDRAIARHNSSGHALIEILHVAQKLYGHLTPPLLRHVAGKLRLPLSHVLGVATFYHLFSMTPKGDHDFTVCMGTACYVAGSPELLETLEHRCVKAGHTSADGRVSVGTARCVGSCGVAPVLLCDGQFRARMSRQKLEAELRRIGGSK